MILSILFALSHFAVFADDKQVPDKRIVDVQVLNSPIKEEFGKFKITLPAGVSASSGTYTIMPASTGATGAPLINVASDKIALKNEGGAFIALIKMSRYAPGTYSLSMAVEPDSSLVGKLFPRKDAEPYYGGAITFQIDTSLEVADPGESGKTTVQGIDADQDGIRDDIQRWINESFQSSRKMRAAIKQAARDSQNAILAVSDQTASIRATHAKLKSLECLHFIADVEKADALADLLKSKMQNTRARIRAAHQASANFNGQYYVLADRDKKASTCRFDLNALNE